MTSMHQNIGQDMASDKLLGRHTEKRRGGGKAQGWQLARPFVWLLPLPLLLALCTVGLKCTARKSTQL
jgi:hypothetical protein